MLIEALRLALQAIRRNALRSFLTTLGIIIGVGAVIALVTIGSGTTARISADLARLGTGLLIVAPGQLGPGRAAEEARPFTERDVEAMREQLSGIRAVAPAAQRSVRLIAGNESYVGTVIGTDDAYLVTQSWALTAGRGFLEGELRGGRAACLLGHTLRERLFGHDDPIGQPIRVQNVACEVVGLLEARGAAPVGIDQDAAVLIPLRAFHRRIAGNTDITRIEVSAREGVDTARVQADIERLLRERRTIQPGRPDDFTVRDMRQIVEAATGTATLLTGLLGAVAAVSLVVGGIGIMNIMLVSVTERTREIGIRLAIGALEGQVLLQFLVEAVVLSLLGGVIGIALGLGLALLATGALEVPFVLDPAIVLIAFGFSALVGIVFGYFPARRAARLDPIEALRRE